MRKTRLLNPFHKRTQYIPSSSYQPFIVTGNSIVANPQVDAASALKHSDLYAVVNLISSDVAAAVLHVRNAGDVENMIRSETNPLINSYSFWQSALVQLLLTGNSYLLIHVDEQGIWLEQIPVSQITIEMGDDSDVIQYQVTFNDKRGTTVFPSSKMLHFRLMPNGEAGFNGAAYIGVSPLQALTMELQEKDLAQKVSMAQLKRALIPSTVITVPQNKLNKDAKKAIRDAFDEQTKGDASTVVMDNSATLSTITVDKEVNNLLQSIDWSTAHIAGAYGIPENYILSDKGDQQSSMDQVRSLYISSLNKYLLAVQSELAKKLNQPKLDFDILGAVDLDSSLFVANLSKFTSGTNPVYSPNQVQELLDAHDVINAPSAEYQPSAAPTLTLKGGEKNE